MRARWVVLGSAALGVVDLLALLCRWAVPELKREPWAPGGWLIVPVLGLGALVYALHRLWALGDNPVRPGRWIAVAALGTLLLCGGLSVCHPTGFAFLPGLVLNPASNSYYQTAKGSESLWGLLDGYDARMAGFVSHAQTQGAGPVVLFGLLGRLFSALPTTEPVADTLLALKPGLTSEALAGLFSRWWHWGITPRDAQAALFCGWTVVLLAALAVFPLYSLAREVLGYRPAVVAVGAYALLPNVLLFCGAADQVHPLLTAATALFVLRGLRAALAGARRASVVWALAGAGTLSAAVFLSLGMAALALGLAVAVGLTAWRERPRGQRLQALGQLWPPALALTGAVVGVFALLYLVAGYNLLGVAETSDTIRRQGYDLLWGRPFWPYVLWRNWVEAIVFLGPLLVLGAVGFVRAWRTPSVPSVFTGLMAGLALMLLAMDASGKIRGETSRMWMFLAPWFALACGGAAVGEEEPSPSLGLWLIAGAYVLIVRHFVHVWGY